MYNYVQFCIYSSVDSWLLNRPKHTLTTVPFWNYFIIKYQFGVLYAVAGLKKLSREWLSGYAMSNLSLHWVFTPFRYIQKSFLKLNLHYYSPSPSDLFSERT